MRVWLRGFRKTAFALKNISGFSCLWPFWDGREEFFFTQMEWRPFLFHKQRVSFVGMAEQGPIPAFKWKSTGLTLHHRPHRSSFGLNYVLFRRQSYRWRKCIAASLMRRPIDLPCWHYSRETWPIHWAQIIQKPWSVGLRRFIRILAVNLGSMPKKGFKFFQSELFGAPFHQLLISWTYGFCRLKSGQGYDAHPSANHRV
jgi:hypothetical protein